MKYNEMVKFLKDNGINTIQPIIANEVSAQLEENVSDEEFENICHKIYVICCDCVESPNIHDLVNEELVIMGYKQ